MFKAIIKINQLLRALDAIQLPNFKDIQHDKYIKLLFKNVINNIIIIMIMIIYKK